MGALLAAAATEAALTKAWQDLLADDEADGQLAAGTRRFADDAPAEIATMAAELLSVPSGHVERLVLFGPVGLSAGARSWALTNHVDVILASRRGGYLGQLSGDGTRRVHRLRAQLVAADDPTRAAVLGRAIVAAKISKQVVLLQRQTRRGPHQRIAHAAAAMRTLLGMLPDAATRDEIMGVEGAAAREYFTALGALMPEPLRFDGRSRRPPLDVVNAALSFGYTILCGEAVAALAAAGLDPAIGILHSLADRRPSLALDLMEEFRPLIVDQVVIEAVTTGRLRAEQARTDQDRPGVLLTKAGRRPSSTATSGACCAPPGAHWRASPAAGGVTCTGRPKPSQPGSTPTPPGPACHGDDHPDLLRHLRRHHPSPGRRDPATGRRPHPAQRLRLRDRTRRPHRGRDPPAGDHQP